ncbi:MAG TPA: DUF4870 domain-containing protein [Candidatus Sulfotelmatobacter sp.]|nr:DUF4870 domain-containing protein [Candidatus Sulfotelmatobacter sp.]
MPYCNMCGAQIADGSTCPACASRAATVPPVAAASAPGMTDNVAGMLAYVTIIPAIIFLVVAPYNRNRFIRFHAWQCIFFTIAWWVLWMGLSIVAHIPLLGWLSILIWPLIGLAGFIIWIVLLIKAYQGQMFKLPMVGGIAEKQANAM